MIIDHQRIMLRLAQEFNLNSGFPLKPLIDAAEALVSRIQPLTVVNAEEFEYAVTCVAAAECARYLNIRDIRLERERDMAIKQLQSSYTVTLPFPPDPSKPQPWARATRGVDTRTDQWLEPTIGQMIHFQAVARALVEAGSPCDAELEHGALVEHGRDAFEWFFGRPIKSDFSADEVRKVWAREDIHNSRTRARMIGSPGNKAVHESPYAFLKVCAAHGLMIRIGMALCQGTLPNQVSRP
jgi:hypothetical protein